MRNILSAIVVGVAAVAIGALSANPSLAADNRTPDKQAQDRLAAEYRATMTRSDTAYKRTMDLCKRMNDKERTDCIAQAAADLKKAQAHAKVHLRSASAWVAAQKRKADYEASLKCESLRGKAREECRLNDGKPKYGSY